MHHGWGTTGRLGARSVVDQAAFEEAIELLDREVASDGHDLAVAVEAVPIEGGELGSSADDLEGNRLARGIGDADDALAPVDRPWKLASDHLFEALAIERPICGVAPPVESAPRTVSTTLIRSRCASIHSLTTSTWSAVTRSVLLSNTRSAKAIWRSFRPVR